MSERRPVVLHVLEALTGGTSRHLVDLVSNAHSAHHEVVIPSERFGGDTDTDAFQRLADAGATVHVVDMRRMPAHPDNARAFATVRRLLRQRHADVVHGHASVGGALARIANRTSARVPSAWTPNGIIDRKPVLAAERALSALTTRIVAVSPSESDLLLRRRIARPDQVVVIPNGIDPTPTPPGERVDLRQQLGLSPDAKLVGTIGRLVPQKAPLEFVEMCRIIAAERPDAHFAMIGDGPLAEAVDQALAGWPSRDSFHRLAHVPNASRMLASFDVFALLSAYEGAPYAPLEAMRDGVAIVLSDVVGSRDAVIDGTTGFLVPYRDPGAAAQRVIQLLDSPDLRSQLTQRANAELHEKFTAAAMGAAHDRLYDELVRGSSLTQPQ